MKVKKRGFFLKKNKKKKKMRKGHICMSKNKQKEKEKKGKGVKRGKQFYNNKTKHICVMQLKKSGRYQ